MKKTQSTFEINDLLPIGLTFVVVGIGIAYGLNVMGDMKTDFIAENKAASCGLNSTGGTGGTIQYNLCGAEYNATEDAIAGVAKIPSKLPLIATVVVAALVIGILVRYLMTRYM